MALFITSLNSGSNGNCYYVGNEHDAVLVDAGISCRETEKRMLRLGLSMKKVRAIFVSHEHSDHIRGIPVLAKKYNLPVYFTKETFGQCRFHIETHLIHYFKGHESIAVGELLVTTFPKLHDAIEPHSFVVNYNGLNVGVFTDIGSPCENLATYFRGCHAAFLEANYDEGMLDKGSYPIYLKNRIRGGKGHLSNRQALQFFLAQRPAYMSHLVLSHLSKENNCPELVQELFNTHAHDTEIIVASRYNETPVYTITGTKTASFRMETVDVSIQPVQASLF
ncbi:MBL fold metallo-hydrolase [Chitinophagaceae bacterium LB-8]|uniref:MBL fold metallo-hydrolase n=1 Tax=Paraflavisolibacter caeni TaxID=2982496 RepID=A0A9X3BK70_9BACT|nr:MBL fold metallo-hydrolase [Paraflavisolibacter caeni]MCU7552353.1 MBL fold metallo-hydrolase [Paraflavisolibacter caeni]